MIPPFLAATLAKPAVKWGAIGGAVLLLVVFTNWKTYDYMRSECEESKLAAIAEQSQESAKQQLKGAEMASAVSGDTDRQSRELRSKITELERKVASHAAIKQHPCPIDPGLVQLLDEYGRLLNNASQDRVSASDGGAGVVEVPRGRVGDSQSPQVQGEDDPELTMDELNRYVADLARLYGAMKLKYRGLSEFDDQRLAIERQQFEEVAP